jgi:hypothetical protein
MTRHCGFWQSSLLAGWWELTVHCEDFHPPQRGSGPALSKYSRTIQSPASAALFGILATAAGSAWLSSAYAQVAQDPLPENWGLPDDARFYFDEIYEALIAATQSSGETGGSMDHRWLAARRAWNDRIVWPRAAPHSDG